MPSPRLLLSHLALLGTAVLGAIGARADDPTAPPPPATQDAATQAMVRRLEKLAEDADPADNPFETGKGIERLRRQIAISTNPEDLIRLRPILAEWLLNDGQTAAALDEFRSFHTWLVQNGLTLSSADDARLRLMQGITELRLGEEQNCLAGHNPDSCILPIQGGGIHKNTTGAAAAAATFTELLDKYPQELEGAWLLNIAHMTLGDYPQGVPRRWVLPRRIFESEYPLAPFPEVAGQLGLDVNDVAGSVIMDDFDNDGWLDLLVSSSAMRGQLRLFKNLGDGSFTERTAAAGLTGIVGGLNLIQADYNNDGWMDAFVVRGGWLGEGGRIPNSLLRNNGDGTFSDVTVAAGLLSFHPSQAAVWLDFNNDGQVDLFIANEHAAGKSDHPCELYSNNGDGTFTSCAAACGVEARVFGKAVVAGDYDNDGRTDLYISTRGGKNLLFHNEGPDPQGQWHFTDRADAAGVSGPAYSFPAAFFDYDNDGWLDLFVAGYAIHNAGEVARDYLGLPHDAERSRLYHNRGDGTFEDVSQAAGLNRVIHAMGLNIGDVDNDGWLDFYAGTGDPFLGMLVPNRLFRNDGGRRFQDVTGSSRFGQLQKGHGIAFGDLNHDGQQDVYSVVGGAYPGDRYHNQLFANPGHPGHWLKLRLEGNPSNRAALGARISVVTRNPDGSLRLIHRQVGSGASFGASPLGAEIGLGEAVSIDRVEVYWPRTGALQVLRGLEPDRSYRIQEGTTEVVPVSERSFAWPRPGEMRLTRYLEWCAPAKPVSP